MKKLIFSMAFGLPSLTGSAEEIRIDGYDWAMTDIASKGLNKDTMFERMDNKFVKAQKSICSNRAHMWAVDFKKQYGLNTAKIFLFYTKKKKSRASQKTWWYHVAPAINENGTVVVMDPGFPGFVDGPLNILDWAQTMTESRNCKEIKPEDTDLIELMFRMHVYPHRTQYGWHDCYYILTPHTIWTPGTVAMSLLGTDSKGRPVRFTRPEFDKDEYYQACIEATTGKIGLFFGGNKDKCKSLAQKVNW